MALQSQAPDTLVPLRRVLPVVGSNVSMAAHRVVRGRLRFFVRTGLRIYVPQEDYLALCEAAWNVHVLRLTGSRRTLREIPPRTDDAGPCREEEAPRKPIHDGRALDRFRKSPLLRWADAFRRWWRSR